MRSTTTLMAFVVLFKIVMVSARRLSHSSGIDSHYFSIDVKVVVGSGTSYNVLLDTEIYSQNDNSFQYGPLLPYSLAGAATVQYGNSLIVIGGVNGDCFCDNSGNMVVT